MRAAYHLRFGSVAGETLLPNESLTRPQSGDDAIRALESLLPGRGGRNTWSALRPDNFVYGARWISPELAREFIAVNAAGRDGPLHAALTGR